MLGKRLVGCFTVIGVLALIALVGAGIYFPPSITIAWPRFSVEPAATGVEASDLQGDEGTQGAGSDQTEIDQSGGNAASAGDGFGVDNPYMVAYQQSLEYEVSEGMRVPADLLDGFTPVESLVMTDLVFPDTAENPNYEVSVPSAPADVSDYECFPQAYDVSDDFNRGCSDLESQGKLPWDRPMAGYNDGNNWSCESPDGWCADTISPFNWRVLTGFRVCHPAVGCIQDPDGGAAMIVLVNFHDSVETWNVRNDSAVFVDDGFIGYGMMWDLGGTTYDVGEGIAAIRNHYLFNLSVPVGGDNRYAGQCGSSDLCETVTYVVVARVWDRPEIGIEFSHFEVLDYGQWER
jgi:hypothetical protein